MKKLILIMITLFATACECEFPFSDSVNRIKRYDYTTDTADILVLFGDSNAGGIGEADDYINAEMDSLSQLSYRYNSTGGGISPHSWETLQPGINSAGLSNHSFTTWCVETPIAIWYYQLFGKPLYILKTGLGGIEAAQAAANSFHPLSASTNYPTLLNPLEEALITSTGLPSAITTYRLHLVWHHGANDANDAGYAASYGTSIDDIFTELETDLGESFDTVTSIEMSDSFDLIDTASVNSGLSTWISGLGSRGTLIDPGLAQTEGLTHWTGAGQMDIAKEIFLSIFFE
jgi:hypothetical protein